MGQAEEAEGAISNESDDFFSPVASADALAPLEGQQKEFKTLRRRHSVMPAQNSSRGTMPQSIDEPAPKARAQRRTPQSRARCVRIILRASHVLIVVRTLESNSRGNGLFRRSLSLHIMTGRPSSQTCLAVTYVLSNLLLGEYISPLGRELISKFNAVVADCPDLNTIGTAMIVKILTCARIVWKTQKTDTTASIRLMKLIPVCTFLLHCFPRLRQLTDCGRIRSSILV